MKSEFDPQKAVENDLSKINYDASINLRNIKIENTSGRKRGKNNQLYLETNPLQSMKNNYTEIYTVVQRDK